MYIIAFDQPVTLGWYAAVTKWLVCKDLNRSSAKEVVKHFPRSEMRKTGTPCWRTTFHTKKSTISLEDAEETALQTTFSNCCLTWIEHKSWGFTVFFGLTVDATEHEMKDKAFHFRPVVRHSATIKDTPPHPKLIKLYQYSYTKAGRCFFQSSKDLFPQRRLPLSQANVYLSTWGHWDFNY